MALSLDCSDFLNKIVTRIGTTLESSVNIMAPMFTKVKLVFAPPPPLLSYVCDTPATSQVLIGLLQFPSDNRPIPCYKLRDQSLTRLATSAIIRSSVTSYDFIKVTFSQCCYKIGYFVPPNDYNI